MFTISFLFFFFSLVQRKLGTVEWLRTYCYYLRRTSLTRLRICIEMIMAFAMMMNYICLSQQKLQFLVELMRRRKENWGK